MVMEGSARPSAHNGELEQAPHRRCVPQCTKGTQHQKVYEEQKNKDRMKKRIEKTLHQVSLVKPQFCHTRKKNTGRPNIKHSEIWVDKINTEHAEQMQEKQDRPPRHFETP